MKIDIEEQIDKDNSSLRRERLLALTQIATNKPPYPEEDPETGRNPATVELKEILDLEPGQRNQEPEYRLKEFFNRYIPGEWIVSTEVTVEDQEFLLNVEISGNPFWFDWG